MVMTPPYQLPWMTCFYSRAVARGARRPLLVGDLPFGSYEQSSAQAVGNATRLLKEGNMDAVKLEGGYGSRVAAAKAIVEAGIAVMGHVGLTPQAISALGGFRPQGQTSSGAMTVLNNALALQESGCFAIVLECLPSPVAAAITSTLIIPTIGIGAGPQCSGQVLVYHDILGMMQHPHYAKVTPKFCKRYAHIGNVINEALVSYRDDVTNGSFPSAVYSPYRIDQKEAESFLDDLKYKGLSEAAEAASNAIKQMNEHENISKPSKKSD
ncbi:hypothetical protein L7F22_062152 [Adiantum nelumboides]|nr:hypothetical protein [Adiantum nelumboides]